MFAAVGHSGCRSLFTPMSATDTQHRPVTLHQDPAPEAMQVKSPTNVIRKTSDYSIFKPVEGNRPLNEKHVLELMERMEEHDFHEDDAINVTVDMQVVDGQHRLEARMRLGRPVYYKISKSMRPEDIAVVNSSNSNWKLNDYIAYHIAKGNQEYVKLREFAEKWNILPYNAIGLLSGNSAQPGSGEVKSVERGEFIISNLAHAESVMEHVQEFAEFMPYARSKAFMNCLVRVMRLPAYNKEEMLKKAMQQREKFTTKYNDVRSWSTLLEDIFNHRRPTGTAVNFRVA
jgi:hypothetical protein